MDDPDPREAPAAPVSGLRPVDDVVTAVGDLDRTPVAEHVATFEAAHQALRRSLDTPG